MIDSGAVGTMIAAASKMRRRYRCCEEEALFALQRRYGLGLIVADMLLLTLK